MSSRLCPSCHTGHLVAWGDGWMACTSCGEMFDPENEADVTELALHQNCRVPDCTQVPEPGTDE